MEYTFVNLPVIFTWPDCIWGCALYVHVGCVVFEIEYIIKIQYKYNVTRYMYNKNKGLLSSCWLAILLLRLFSKF